MVALREGSGTAGAVPVGAVSATAAGRGASTVSRRARRRGPVHRRLGMSAPETGTLARRWCVEGALRCLWG
ncbi:hypothetical protein GCM10010297_34930 [Streptomyces malachitofuscus]|nr:hypothetical protein GCM10010297_34930 [Streptomyces malachitofuscus]